MYENEDVIRHRGTEEPIGGEMGDNKRFRIELLRIRMLSLSMVGKKAPPLFGSSIIPSCRPPQQEDDACRM